jgi:hypothetical protein
VPTTLADGRTLDESVNDNVTMLRDFLFSGERLITERMGKAPSLVLWYAHSAGVIAGRLFNYSGRNDKPGGGHYVAGFLSDDPGGGLPLPLTMPMGQVLGDHNGTVTYPANALLPDAIRAQLVPEFTFADALYVDRHSWLPDVSNLSLKELGEQLYQQEGLQRTTDLYVVCAGEPVEFGMCDTLATVAGRGVARHEPGRQGPVGDAVGVPRLRGEGRDGAGQGPPADSRRRR